MHNAIPDVMSYCPLASLIKQFIIVYFSPTIFISQQNIYIEIRWKIVEELVPQSYTHTEKRVSGNGVYIKFIV